MTARPPTFTPPRFGKRLARPEDVRPSAARRGYDQKWRAIRAAFLKKNVFCKCGDPATEVDHIVSLRNGGTNATSNLMAMCKRCHARKTVAVDGGFGRKKSLGPSPPRPLCHSKILVHGIDVDRE